MLTGTSNIDRIEAPVTAKGYMICAFAACEFGGGVVAMAATLATVWLPC